jgi:hypothetical protein
MNSARKDHGVIQEGDHHRDTIAVALSAAGDIRLKYVVDELQKCVPAVESNRL